jgi:hypothetical protein
LTINKARFLPETTQMEAYELVPPGNGTRVELVIQRSYPVAGFSWLQPEPREARHLNFLVFLLIFNTKIEIHLFAGKISNK